MRIAYVVSLYPAVSHTFVQREILELRTLGFGINTFSVRKAGRKDVLTATDQLEAQKTTALHALGLFTYLRAHVRALVTRPAVYISTLKTALSMRNGGLKSAIWKCFHFAEAVALWQQCRQRRIKHIHAHFANVGADLAMLATQLAGEGHTWSFTMHGPTEFADVYRHHLAEKIRSASMIACISHFCRSQMMALVEPAEWDKMQIVHCGIYPAAVARPPRARGEVINILCVGRLVPVKGQHVLLDAATELSRRGHKIKLTFVGDGPDRKRLEHHAEQQLLNVEFTGSVGQDRVAQLYGEADIFCLPSFCEGVPVVLMEAMSSGVPVVTTRIMGVPELVDDQLSGLLVPPGDGHALTQALERLILDPAYAAALAERGRRKVAAEFNLEDEVRRLGDLFTSQLAPQSGAAVPAAIKNTKTVLAGASS